MTKTKSKIDKHKKKKKKALSQKESIQSLDGIILKRTLLLCTVNSLYMTLGTSVFIFAVCEN